MQWKGAFNLNLWTFGGWAVVAWLLEVFLFWQISVAGESYALWNKGKASVWGGRML